jgi:hydroxypyruvate reductase
MKSNLLQDEQFWIDQWNRFIGSNQIALNAASQKAGALGYHPLILANAIEGEAREVAKFLAAVAKQLKMNGQPVPSPACILSGGEPTVTLKGEGKGGRNQELALAAGIEIEGLNDIVIASVGTDGTDGPTDAAGGFADGEMMKKARKRQLQPVDFLARNDSYPFLENLGYLIKTGPTGTNVMDIHIILSDQSPVT